VTARRLQLAGHKPVILVGGATGMIGDPKEAGERVLNSTDVVTGWVERIASRWRGSSASTARTRRPS
jgi:tyrosyl-tRNA synthetase